MELEAEIKSLELVRNLLTTNDADGLRYENPIPVALACVDDVLRSLNEKL